MAKATFNDLLNFVSGGTPTGINNSANTSSQRVTSGTSNVANPTKNASFDDLLSFVSGGTPQTRTSGEGSVKRGQTPTTGNSRINFLQKQQEDALKRLEAVGSDKRWWQGTHESAEREANERKAIQEELEQIREELLTLDPSLVKYSTGERILNTISGAMKDTGAGIGNAVSTLGQWGNEHDPDNPAYGTYNVLDEAYYAQLAQEAERQNEIQAWSDKTADEAGLEITKAKAGLGKVGQFVVDVGVAGTQLAGDTVLNLVPGLGAASLALRAGGSAAREAREEGANLDQQLTYGLASAGLEMLTEKISGLGDWFAYGRGWGDDLTEAIISKLAKSDGGRTVIRLLASGVSEGSEEAISELLNPALKAIYDSGTAAQYSYLTEEGRKELVADAASSALVGAALGMVGGGVGIATGQNAQQNAELRRKETEKAEQQAKWAPSDEDNVVAEMVERGAGLRNEGDITAEEYSQILNNLNNQTDSKNPSKPEGQENPQSITQKPARINNLQAQRLTEANARAEAESRLEAQGVKADAKTLDAITRAVATADELTKAETEAIANTKGAEEVVSRMRMNQVFGGEWDFQNQKDKTRELQSDYDVSEDGKIINQNTGEEVSISGISAIRKGEVHLRLSDGSSVRATDIAYASNGQALIYETVGKMAEGFPSSANKLVTTYDETQASPTEFAYGLREAYTYGFYNYSQARLAKSEYGKLLDDEQRRIAYALGQKAAGKSIAQQQAEAKIKKKKESAVNGQTHVKDVDVSKLTDKQTAGIQIAKMLHETLGINVYVYESYEKNGKRMYIDEKGDEVEAPNGYYKQGNGTLHIDLNAGNSGQGTVAFTLAHELTHAIKEWSPRKFKVLANYLVQKYEQNGQDFEDNVLKQQKRLNPEDYASRDAHYDAAYEEAVADAMENILASGNVVQTISEIRQQDKSLAQKILDLLKEWVDKIKEGLSAYKNVSPESAEARAIENMRKTVEGFEDAYKQLEQIFAEGVVEAAENMQRAEKNASTGSANADSTAKKLSSQNTDATVISETQQADSMARVKHQARPSAEEHFVKDKYFDRQIDKWEEKADGARIKVGELREDSALNRVGFPAEGMWFDVGKIKKSFGKHGDHMTKAVLKAIPTLLNNPIAITEYKGPNGDIQNSVNVFGMLMPNSKTPIVVGVVMTKARNGITIINKIRTIHAHGNADINDNNILYLNEDKKRTRKWFQVCGNSVPLEGTKFGLIRKISYVEPTVKRSSRNNTDLEKVNAILNRQNTKLKADVEDLKALLELRKSVTDGTKYTLSSVESASKILMKGIGAKGDIQELKSLLNTFYEGIVKMKEPELDSVREEAQPAIDWLQNHLIPRENETGYAYEVDLIEQEIANAVYDSFWRVLNLREVPGDTQKEISKLYSKHKERMKQINASYTESVSRLKREHAAEIVALKERRKADLQAQQRELIDYYQGVQDRARDSRNRTQLRRQVRKVIRDLNKILNHGDKKRNVKQDMRELVQTALSSAEILFTDNATRDDMLRNGIVTETTSAEKALINSATTLLSQLDNAENEAIEKQYKRLLTQLNGVFARERQRMNNVPVTTILEQLRTLYKGLEASEYGYISGAYSEEVAEHLESLIADVKGTLIRDMSADQLTELYKAYRMVLTTVRNANRMFNENIKQTREETVSSVIREVKATGRRIRNRTEAERTVGKFWWSNLKPVYAFARIGSDTLTKLYENMRSGEDKWAINIHAAKAFYHHQVNKYHAEAWDMGKRFKFKTEDGEIELGLGQMLSLYAYSKREAALDHLMKGGFVFDNNAEVKTEGKVFKRTYLNDDATAHSISLDLMNEITSKLTAEQKAFADAMQDYLSKDMGALGNEVSMELYGIELFGEKYYFPLRSAGQYLAKASENDKQQQKVNPRIVSSGFTKALKPHASNPVVLSDFMDVWTDHVNDMLMYNAFVLPMEDFRRVYEYATPNVEGQRSEAVKAIIQNAFGTEANKYLEQLYNDLNGGVRSDPTESVAKRMLGNFKKAAVFSSASVVIQQPSAIGRAFALVDPKYFVGDKIGVERGARLWEEAKKYAPIALIKEMGYFDMDMGMSTRDFITAPEYRGLKQKAKAVFTDSNYRDELLSKAPALADQLTWCSIWDAVKRETRAKHPTLKIGSEEFLKAAGARFTEVIEKTQVYDSVFSRSENMRSKSAFMSMAMAFMAEPTTTANMVEIALRSKDKRQIARVVGAAAASMILNSLLVSIVYAARDDDEYKTYWEKYLASLTKEVLDGFNPLTYLPYLKDIWSIMQGYDVERADMSLVSDIWKSVGRLADVVEEYDKDMTEEEKNEWNEKLWDSLLGTMEYGFAVAGSLPLKNIRRDVEGLRTFFNTVNEDIKERDTTAATVADAMQDALLESVPLMDVFFGESKDERYLEAVLSGDEAYIERMEAMYADEDKAASALKGAIRAGLENKTFTREKAAELLVEHLDMSKKDAEATALKWMCKVVNGFSYDEIKDKFIAGEIDAARAIELRSKYGGYSKDDARKTVRSWKFEADYGFAYDSIKSEFLEGNISASRVIEMKMKYGDKTREQAEESVYDYAYAGYKEGVFTRSEARNLMLTYSDYTEVEIDAKIVYIDFKRDFPNNDVSSAWANTYVKNGLDKAGVPFEIYVEFRNHYNEVKDTIDGNKIRMMDYIDSLPLSNEGKDALYMYRGYNPVTIYSAPWR